MKPQTPEPPALAARLSAVAARPSSPVAEHNLAALLGDLGRSVEGEAAARRAFAKGGDAPETWLVLARALMAQGRYDDSEAAYRAALARRPGFIDAVRDLGQLIWMRTADRASAMGPVQEALALSPADTALQLLRAALMEYAGDDARDVWRTLMDAGVADHPEIELARAHAALAFDLDQALTHALRAAALAPSDLRVWLRLTEARLARGEAAEALALTASLVERFPVDQNVLSLAGLANRLAGRGDDDSDLVGSYVVDTPAGWPDLTSWLAELATSLRRLHGLRTHPVGQSLRHGTQTAVDLKTSDDPVIQAFFSAVQGPISRHVEALGSGADPVRRRNTGAWRMGGCWSVQLSPGGFHAPHVHPEGWLSSACYVELPPAVAAGGREGWLGFGGAPFAQTLLPPVRFEKPEPGKLVLFPSYLWHGTVPFSGVRPRLTVAFDILPT
ncbi:MAG: putative 2OG-Fe(II) oxygenase [Brevundimonas sp.]|uniref:putative 2OG-Fe(II) oxygenase n=1 Tax=Brevundimonas sp. TaxID=1871086 RepID=UPI002723F3C6|nr:putative 2OG-Fe(II) oxygenase [Brevundimonas sp.]MDO9586640.1 putative 2OG-Fe(II) oxygenase [Brevundimonas sp.]MDP3369528.1 putative 2OG-Fe(II) oxygenase [Brevundimonas sp.]MDP3656622.1 putative 2OG-Fe(II) oxygenase [Brevundimonas sp.]MDZ4108849.1 putative 2OG-Fe(II) oxygenase [Brevundimonas sp.]